MQDRKRDTDVQKRNFKKKRHVGLKVVGSVEQNLGRGRVMTKYWFGCCCKS